MEARRIELKMALLESLRSILSDSQHTRQQGEEHLNVIEMTPGLHSCILETVFDECPL